MQDMRAVLDKIKIELEDTRPAVVTEPDPYLEGMLLKVNEQQDLAMKASDEGLPLLQRSGDAAQ